MRLKRILLALITIIAVVALSGCANVTCTLNLQDDGKVDVNASVLYSDREFSYDNEVIEKIKKDFSDNGYTVTLTEENGLKGFVIEKEDFNLNDFNESLYEEFNIKIEGSTPDDLEFKEGFLYNKYNIDSDVNLSSFSSLTSVKDGEGNIITGDELQKLLSHLSLKFVVKLDKGTILNTNAAKLSADKKTAEWVLIPGTDPKIELEAMTTAVLPIIGTVVILGVIALLSMILLILFTKMYFKRRKECNK